LPLNDRRRPDIAARRAITFVNEISVRPGLVHYYNVVLEYWAKRLASSPGAGVVAHVQITDSLVPKLAEGSRQLAFKSLHTAQGVIINQGYAFLPNTSRNVLAKVLHHFLAGESAASHAPDTSAMHRDLKGSGRVPIGE